MEKRSFEEILRTYELPIENVYEDLSEVGTVFWHSDTAAIKVVCLAEGSPCLSLVVQLQNNDYCYFESELSGFSTSEIMEIIAYAKSHSESLKKSAIEATESLAISCGGKSWSFYRT